MIFNETFFENRQKYNDYLHIRSIGRVNADSTYIIERECSKTYVFGFVKSGNLFLTMNDQTYCLKSGESFLLPFRIDYKIYNDRNFPATVLWVNMRGELIECLHRALFGKEPVFCSYYAEKDFIKLISLVKEGSDIHEIIEVTVNMLTGAKRSKIELTHEKNPSGEDINNAFDAYISNCIQSGFSVKEMADYFNISVSKINRIFKKKYNTTPYQYYQSIRIDVAKSLLNNSELSIEDISERLKYTDRNYFSLTFSQKTGLPPAKYKKKFNTYLK